jgi:hypothetical protein
MQPHGVAPAVPCLGSLAKCMSIMHSQMSPQIWTTMTKFPTNHGSAEYYIVWITKTLCIVLKRGSNHISFCPLSLLSTALRVVFLRLPSLSLSSGDLAGRSDRERAGQLPCTICRSFTSGRPWWRGVEALGGFFCIVVVVLRLRVSAIFSFARPWWCGRRWSAHSALWRFE